MKFTQKFLSVLIGCIAAMASAPNAIADDSEVFTNSAFVANGVLPNVLFIIDTSGSMDTVANTYDPSQDYSSGTSAICPRNDRVYWTTTNSATPPDCRVATDQWVSVDNNRCRTAANGMAGAGWWNGRTQMLITGGNPTFWGNLVARTDAKLECSGDSGNHGDQPGTSPSGAEDKYARNGTGNLDTQRWGTAASGSQVAWNTKPRYSLYSTNYINWYYGAGGSTPKTRLQIVRDVAKTMIDSLDGVNLGLMRYDQRAEGGMIRYPVSQLTATSRTAMKSMLDTYVADGFTPLSETLYEAQQYFAARNVEYGNTSTAAGVPSLSVAASRTGGVITGTTYNSPADFSCQNNFIVYLTDGLPTQDNGADARIQALPNFTTDGGGACPASIPNPDPSWPTDGRCMENLARYLHNHDLRSDVVGDQKVTTYVVGFGDDIATSADFLESVAKAGGGKAFTQTDAAGLSGALEEIFDQVQESADTTFVAPAVAVNAFNRTQNLNQMYVSVFAPSQKKHWPGNLKKYQLWNGDIVGVGNEKAVDPLTGFFFDYITAFNTPDKDPPDGMRAKDGGAAAHLKDWGTRKLYTYLGTDTDLTKIDNALGTGNALITPAMVNAADATDRQNIIEFARGRDATDEDNDQDFLEERKAMGDPMHARPAIVIYGGTEAAPIGTVFTPTNDGYLHAFDMDSGNELWAYVPREFLPRLGDLYDNPPGVNRDYGLDGDVRIWKKDTDNDGVVEPGTPDNDKVYIIFGTGRGGSSYYVLDVTDQKNPVFKWKVSNTDPGMSRLGRTWSTPVVTQINVAGTNKDVLIFGGGYDTTQDGYAYSVDGVGNSIFILDLETGALIWNISSTTGTMTDGQMTHSIPGSVAVLDVDQDRNADRMYAADTGGRIWRFDIMNGQPASSLVQGGVLATLGGASFGAPTLAQNRRFYNAPDPVLISYRGSTPFFNISIGTGYRGHPLEKDTLDRFYSIRDFDVYNARTTASYSSGTITEANLQDVTTKPNATILTTEKGWYIRFGVAPLGEKVLGESLTIGGVVYFPTFSPLDPDPAKPCLSRTLNRLYAVYALNGKARFDWDNSGGPLTVGDRSTNLRSGGIAPGLSIFADPIGSTSSSSTSSSSSSTSSSTGSGGNCVSGVTPVRCVPFGNVNRSFWEHR